MDEGAIADSGGQLLACVGLMNALFTPNLSMLPGHQKGTFDLTLTSRWTASFLLRRASSTSRSSHGAAVGVCVCSAGSGLALTLPLVAIYLVCCCAA